MTWSYPILSELAGESTAGTIPPDNSDEPDNQTNPSKADKYRQEMDKTGLRKLLNIANNV